MKILLDENIDVNFAAELNSHDIYTVNQMGWASKKNGELMQFASDSGFNYFITLDKNIQYQQNLSKYSFSVILLLANNSKLDTLKEMKDKILESISKKNSEKLIRIS